MTDQNSHYEPAPLRIATRASPLAMAQARLVADALPVETELLAISTRGDRTAGALAEVARYTLRRDFRHINPTDAEVRTQILRSVGSLKSLGGGTDLVLLLGEVPLNLQPPGLGHFSNSR